MEAHNKPKTKFITVAKSYYTQTHCFYSTLFENSFKSFIIANIDIQTHTQTHTDMKQCITHNKIMIFELECTEMHHHDMHLHLYIPSTNKLVTISERTYPSTLLMIIIRIGTMHFMRVVWPWSGI